MAETPSQSDIMPPSSSLLDTARSLKRSLHAGLNVLRYRRLVAGQTLPRPARSILVICKGNICRSPLAEAYLKQAIQQQGLAIKVESAGLETSFGKPAHRLAQVVGTQQGLVLAQHATQPLHREQVERADVILVMEWPQRRRVIKLYPQAKRKVFLLRQFYDQSAREVADPYSGTIEDFQTCFAMMKQACDVLMAKLRPTRRV